VSVKAALIIAWACLIAGAAIASESQRLCDIDTQAKSLQLQNELRLHQENSDVLIVTEVYVTS